MPLTSSTYNFAQGTIQQQVIDEAYERVGITANLVTEQKIISAQRSINFILQEWSNKGNNLWTVRSNMLGLTPNQSSYNLTPVTNYAVNTHVAPHINEPTATYYPTPTPVKDVKTVALRNSSTTTATGGYIGGIGPYSSGTGESPNNAFNGAPNTNTPYVASGIGETIGYYYGLNAGVTVTLIGVQVGSAQYSTLGTYLNYAFEIQYLPTGSSFTSTNFVSLPNFLSNVISYPVGVIQWLSVPTPISCDALQITDLNAYSPQPINLLQLYFNNNVYDVIMTRLSEQEYNSQATKSQTGNPSSYYLDRQINPILNLWPIPGALPVNNTLLPNIGVGLGNSQVPNCLFYTYWTSIMDAGNMQNLEEVPARFLEALTAQLAFKLAIKEAPEKAQLLGQLAEQSYQLAASEDRERVPLRIYGDYMQGWGR